MLRFAHYHEYGHSFGLVKPSGEVLIYVWFDRRETGIRIGRLRLAINYAVMN